MRSILYLADVNRAGSQTPPYATVEGADTSQLVEHPGIVAGKNILHTLHKNFASYKNFKYKKLLNVKGTHTIYEKIEIRP